MATQHECSRCNNNDEQTAFFQSKHSESTDETEPSSSVSSSSSEEQQSTRDLLREEAHGLELPPTTTSNSNSNLYTPKRSNYLSWEDYFMSVAFLSSHRSKDPHTRWGACIVNPRKRIVGVGYNGFPRGFPDELLPWNAGTEEDGGEVPWLHTKNPYVCHAEMNAILNKCSADVEGCTMYVARFPCNESAKLIVQSGIRHVVYLTDPHPNSDQSRASRILFQLAGVTMTRHVPGQSRVVIDFGNEQQQKNRETDADTNKDGATAGSTLPLENEKVKDLLLTEANYNLDTHNTPTSTKPHTPLSWDDYFTAIAFLSAQRSKDPNTQVGACIVDEKRRIVAVGYNGFPAGCSDEVLPWSRGDGKSTPLLHTKYPYVCHAETNAILNKCSADVNGATMYVALFPCNECAKMIIQAGIRHVVYVSDKYRSSDNARASRILFELAGVTYRQHVPCIKEIILDVTC